MAIGNLSPIIFFMLVDACDIRQYLMFITSPNITIANVSTCMVFYTAGLCI